LGKQLCTSSGDSTDSGWNGGPALPAASSGQSFTTAMDASANFRHTVSPTEGLEVSYEPDYGDVELTAS